jgi:hypothetical protein
MAVERILGDSRLQARYLVGTTPEGNPIFRSRVLARVKPDSDDQGLMNVANIITNLQIHALAEVRRTDNAELIEI